MRTFGQNFFSGHQKHLIYALPAIASPLVPCPLSSIVAAPLLAPAGLARIIRIRRIRRTVSSIFDYRRTACAPFHSAANFRNESAQEYANNKEFAIDCSKAARRADTLYGDGRKTAWNSLFMCRSCWCFFQADWNWKSKFISQINAADNSRSFTGYRACQEAAKPIHQKGRKRSSDKEKR